ncbi:MAG: L,D-transpeptidase [Prosthecobacter sp.]
MTLFFVATHPAETRAQLGSAVRQVVVGQPADWTSNTASLQCYQRLSAHSPWKPAFARPIPVLLGKKGLAWGQGVFHAPASAIAAKVEKDLKSPAGIFHLGILFGYAVTPPHGVRWPYIQVGPWDAYVDDSSLPFYNKHVRIDPRQGIPPWFERQRMRLGDAAYRWMLEIRHNQHPPLPGYGSAIFFHVRRGPNTPTAGCTALAEVDLVRLLQWLDPKATPHYVLLPKAEYAALRGIWGLP